MSLSEACALLGSLTDERAVSRVLQHLERSPNRAQIFSAITDLAVYLDENPAPIDYAPALT
ncbi:MAG: hypothetical protein ACXVH1_35185 [Solirubrobacteraceae bacterium]